MSRAHAPSAARLLAFALLTGALVSLVLQRLEHRVFGALTRPETDHDRHQDLLTALNAAFQGQRLLGLLLLVLTLVGVVRYRRDIGDPLARHLALGAGLCLTLDIAMVNAFPLIAGPGDESWFQLWWLVGTLLRGGGLLLLTCAIARGERVVLARRPTWAAVAVGLLAVPLLADLVLHFVEYRRTDFDTPSLLELLPLLIAAGTLTLVFGLVAHAERLRDPSPLLAWARAAAGLDNYRDATALRFLLVFVVAAFLPLARVGNFQPRVLLGMLCLFGLTGLVLAVVQIGGLVRLADAPGPRAALAVALPLIGLGLAGECLALAPFIGVVLDSDQALKLQALALPQIGAVTQGLAALAMIALLLTLRGLAAARGAAMIVARCNLLLIVVISLLLALAGLAYAGPELDLRKDSDTTVILVGGLALFYFGVLARLRDVMRGDKAVPTWPPPA